MNGSDPLRGEPHPPTPPCPGAAGSAAGDAGRCLAWLHPYLVPRSLAEQSRASPLLAPSSRAAAAQQWQGDRGGAGTPLSYLPHWKRNVLSLNSKILVNSLERHIEVVPNSIYIQSHFQFLCLKLSQPDEHRAATAWTCTGGCTLCNGRKPLLEGLASGQ